LRDVAAKVKYRSTETKSSSVVTFDKLRSDDVLVIALKKDDKNGKNSLDESKKKTDLIESSKPKVKMPFGDVIEVKQMPQAESIMQSGNLYVYCMSNPIMYSDPSGNLSNNDAMSTSANNLESQRALLTYGRKLAEDKVSLSPFQANYLIDVAKQTGLKKYHGIMTHPNRGGYFANIPHINIGSAHIPVN